MLAELAPILEGKPDESKSTRIDLETLSREYLREWVNAVNAEGRWGRWASDIAREPGEVRDILLQWGKGEDKSK